MRIQRQNKGFTLLEILLVIAAIGILAAIVLVAINPNRQLAQVRNAERRSEINTIYKAIEQYLIDKGSYPTGITTSIQDICINGNTTNCVNLGVLVPDYIAAIPIDPGGGAYRVVINTSNNRVSVYASNAELGQGIGINDRPWTPAQLGSSLALWLDAADSSTITLNGSDVSQWNDKSGNAKHATQATAANQPAYLTTGFNGKPVISFTKANIDHLITPTIANNSIVGSRSITVIQVIKPRTGWAGDYGSPMGTRNDGGSWWSFIRTPATNEFGFHGSAQYWSGSNLAADTSILVDVVSGGNTLNVFRNGSQIGTPNLPIGAFTSTISAKMYIGAGSAVTSNEAYEGDMMEALFLPSVISLADRQKLEGYLAWKWGLTNNLPANHPYKWNGAEFGGVNITDTDAQTYIAAVETADGQSLENNTRLAIQNFITGAKADGIWDAIKSSNILAGARTLNGALVPLKGTAPTNFNFVSGDYNRKTGLVGNGSTKYLNSNRNNNADPQDNAHASAWVSSSTLSTQFYMGGSPELALVANNLVMKVPNSSRTAITPAPVLNFIGGSRNSSSQFTARHSGTSVILNVSSTAPGASSVLLFAGSPSLINSNARLAFYSIGESINLALLDTRVTKLMTDLGNAIP